MIESLRTNKWQAFHLLSLLLFFSACSSKEDDGTTPTDEEVRISIQDLSINEGNDDSNIFVRLQLNRESDQSITAHIRSIDALAEANTDYTPFDNVSIVFEPGDKHKDHQLTIKGDDEFEEEEYFEVVISSVDGPATIDKGTARITIINDDVANTPLVIPTTGYSTPDEYPNMTLIWQDEFEASSVDENYWTFEIGHGNDGWGNNELQFYKKENTSVVDGHLVIEARKEISGSPYTSSRMITKDKFDFKFGRVDIRAALPTGQGLWPALWMLGSNFSSVGWPACGEIDIMEILGHQPNKLYGTAHWADSNNAHASFAGDTTLPSGNFHEAFHVFSIIWDENQIRWLLDDVQYHVMDISIAQVSELRNNQFFIFNVAVGGNWPGSPDASTVFPQRMIVDYIRVFQ